jgi:hypothetical protein
VENAQDVLDRALTRLQASDPIPKLLPQVRLGRMAKDSPALLAITSSWLETFLAVLREAESILDVNGVLRLDPEPRIAMLVEAGILSENDPHAHAVSSAYMTALASAKARDQTTA